MDIKKLEYILALESEQTFSAAAKKLFVSQQNFSTSIKVLEEELGVSLFRRSKWYGSYITEDGKRVAEFSRKVLDLYDELKQDLSTDPDANHLTGELNIFYMGVYAISNLPEIICEFQIKRPKLNIIANEMAFEPLMKRLQEKTPFIALVMLNKKQLKTLKESNLRYRIHFLKSSEFCLTVRAQSPLAQYQKVSVKQSTTYPIFMYTQNSFSASAFFHILNTMLDGTGKELTYSSFDDRNAWIAMVKKSDSLTFTVREFIKQEEEKDIRMIPLDEDFSVGYYIVYNYEPNIAVDRFISFFLQNFRFDIDKSV